MRVPGLLAACLLITSATAAALDLKDCPAPAATVGVAHATAVAHCAVAQCSPDAPAEACAVVVCGAIAQAGTAFVSTVHQCGAVTASCALVDGLIVACVLAQCSQPDGTEGVLGCSVMSFCYVQDEPLPCPGELAAP